MNAKALARVMNVAQGKESADFAVINARLVNVVTREIENVDVLIAEGIIAKVCRQGEGTSLATNSLDANGSYLMPGFIDAHTHIEMSYLSAVPFAEAVLPHGTTAIITDPHDMCNAMGVEGIRLMAEELKLVPLKSFLMIPPCVPSSPKLEDAGATMTLKDVQEAMKLPSVLGIAETMDFTRVLDREPELLSILLWARKNGILVDGHCPELVGDGLQAYALTGPVRTDHESVTVEEMREKYRNGMRIVIRRGSLSEPASAGEFMNSLKDTGNVLLSTDGCITVDDMLNKGHMDYALRCVVEEGVDPVTAVQMATINVARAYGLDQKIGMIAPGRFADMVLVNNLKEFKVQAVFVNGVKVPPAGELRLPRYSYPSYALNTVKMPEVTKDTFRIEAPVNNGEAKVRVIDIIDGTLATRQLISTMNVEDGELPADTSKDLLKVAVFDRYRKTGTYALGIVKGFGFKGGALGGSVGQDTQNIVVVGADDADMALVVNTIRHQQGGIVAAMDGQVTANVKLPIAGIMTDVEPYVLRDELLGLNRSVASFGCKLANPVFTLYMQLTLAVIPEIRITNRGLVDVATAQFLSLFVD